MNKLLARKPDLCVSGINHGANSSVNVLYSGTMAAALEGAIAGVPSSGFSLLDYSQDADFSQSEDHVLRIASCYGKWIAFRDLFKCEYTQTEPN